MCSSVNPHRAQRIPDRVVFLFPGQGAQHIGMARGLYDPEPVFAEHFDQCAAGFGEELGIDLRAEIFEGTARNLERTDRTQPALFTVEYALAKLIESYGVQPAALAGHSIGEYVAGTIAGVFDIETAIKVVSMRARLMHAAPRGVMVAVALSPEAVGRTPERRSRYRHDQRAGRLRGRRDPRRASASSATASPKRASWPAGSAPRTRSTRG